MDALRFGRVLGVGARQAVKTVTAAVDAATAENPSARNERAGANSVGSVERPQARGNAAHTAAQTVVRARGTGQRLRSGGRGFREAVWGPFVRLGGALWLEVTGVFFGIFALFALGGVWRLVAVWHSNTTDPSVRRRLLGTLAMLLLFGYFSVSSFVRAHRRQRRR